MTAELERFGENLKVWGEDGNGGASGEVGFETVEDDYWVEVGSEDEADDQCVQC